jgi:excisionase family DNA binding protein
LGSNVSRIEEAPQKRDVRTQMGTRDITAPKETMTAREVAFEADAHLKTVRRWIREGRLPAQRTGTGRIRVLRADFRKFMGFKDSG